MSDRTSEKNRKLYVVVPVSWKYNDESWYTDDAYDLPLKAFTSEPAARQFMREAAGKSLAEWVLPQLTEFLHDRELESLTSLSPEELVKQLRVLDLDLGTEDPDEEVWDWEDYALVEAIENAICVKWPPQKTSWSGYGSLDIPPMDRDALARIFDRIDTYEIREIDLEGALVYGP